jgi:hypothetical protein
MNILKCPEKYKQYRITMSNKSEYIVDGETKKNIVTSKGNWVELKDGSIINKAFIIEFKLDIRETQTDVYKHKDEIQKYLVENVLLQENEKHKNLMKKYE